MLKESMVVLKAVRRNNLYYVKDNTVTGKLEISIGSNDDSTML